MDNKIPSGTHAMDIQSLHKYCLNLAKVAYMDNASLDGSLIIYAECENPENNVTWGIGVGNNAEKQLALKSVAIAMQHRGAIRYSIMSLSWKAGASKEYSPSNNPERKEVLAVSTSSKTEKIATFTEVLRTGEVMTGYGEEVSTEAQGLMTELLLIEDVPKMVRLAAEGMLTKNILSGKPLDVPASNQPKPH